jgi:glucose-1-phosphate thymidylyltransferase
LGDNFFEDDFKKEVDEFKGGAKIFLHKVTDPERFGVAVIKDKKVVKIVEKPQDKISDLAITGLYIYDNRVIEVAKGLKPSARGELEITDIHNWYLAKKELEAVIFPNGWIDMGTFESLYAATKLAYKNSLINKFLEEKE